MAKQIAIWGSPNAGKTTFATKLARSIYDEYQSTVIVVYTDFETPTLPVIFPTEKKENLFSIGVPLAGTEITEETVVPQIVTVKNRVNLGFVGFKDGENRYTYPRFDAEKCRSLYKVLGSLADYLVIDCTSNLDALKHPIVDEERGIAASVRFLHPQRINLDHLADTGFATKEMVYFLCTCIRYGVPFVVAGATSSGKTTLLNAIMTSIPDNKRVFTIESGSRELSLIRRDADGNVTNNVVHTLSRPSDNEVYDITQEDLVVSSLRFNPDVVCIGEMRDSECYSAVEASLTGHTVVSTVHAGPGAAAHMRIALLCQKRFPIDFNTSLTQAGQAFPVVVYTHKLENNARKIMDISECIITPKGEREYNCLYDYRITKNNVENGKLQIDGYFHKPNLMSENLRRRLIQYGVPQTDLDVFLKGGNPE